MAGLGFGHRECVTDGFRNRDSVRVVADNRGLDGNGTNDRLVVCLIDVETQKSVGVAHEGTNFQIRLSHSHAAVATENPVLDPGTSGVGVQKARVEPANSRGYRLFENSYFRQRPTTLPSRARKDGEIPQPVHKKAGAIWLRFFNGTLRMR